MLICNFKVNKNKCSKILVITITLIVLALACFIVYQIYSKTVENSSNSRNTLPVPDIIDVNSSNYTNVLKAVHDNPDSYIGKKIHFVGYVYRVYDFDEEQFVLARNMIISSDLQTLVVGFLCNYTNALNFADSTWVEITGEITKGDYHGTIPVIEVKEMKKIDKPSDEYVYPPDSSYVPTNAWI